MGRQTPKQALVWQARRQHSCLVPIRPLFISNSIDTLSFQRNCNTQCIKNALIAEATPQGLKSSHAVSLCQMPTSDGASHLALSCQHALIRSQVHRSARQALPLAVLAPILYVHVSIGHNIACNYIQAYSSCVQYTICVEACNLHYLIGTVISIDEGI